MEVAMLMREWAPHRRALGDLLSRLVYEERARREERARIRRQLTAVVDADHAA
jgi:hypothetical protein